MKQAAAPECDAERIEAHPEARLALILFRIALVFVTVALAVTAARAEEHPVNLVPIARSR